MIVLDQFSSKQDGAGWRIVNYGGTFHVEMKEVGDDRFDMVMVYYTQERATAEWLKLRRVELLGLPAEVAS